MERVILYHAPMGLAMALVFLGWPILGELWCKMMSGSAGRMRRTIPFTHIVSAAAAAGLASIS